MGNTPLSASEFQVVARDERQEYWDFLDRYRTAIAQVPSASDASLEVDASGQVR